jgi:PAS domain S-box-containing protein
MAMTVIELLLLLAVAALFGVGMLCARLRRDLSALEGERVAAEAAAERDREAAEWLAGRLGTLETRRGEDAREIAHLRLVEARLQKVIETEPECVKLIRPDGTLVMMNAAGLAMIAAPSFEAVEGHCVTDIVRPEYRAGFVAYGQAVLKGETPLPYAFEIEALDGTRHWLETRMVAIADDDGSPLLLGITRDISARVHDQAELAARAGELRAALAEAHAASTAKSAFVSTMSHEIRTPLNGLLGTLQLLATGRLSSEQRAWLATAQSSGRTLMALLTDVLDFSRIESGRIEITPEPVELRPFAEELARLHAIEAAAKGLELVVRVDPQVPVWVEVDPVRLRQVLGNLLVNAIKFTARGEISLNIGPAPHDAVAPGWVALQVCVSDTGIGIAAGDRARIFEPFTQVEAEPGRRSGGSGLGLAIARRIVEAMDGVIEVLSEPGHGTRFTFALTVPALSGKASFCPDIALRGLSALVVAPSAMLREVLVETLETWGISAESAVGPRTALADLKQRASSVGEPYTFVLVDAGLRGEEPMGFVARLRAEPGLPEVKCLLLSPFGVSDCPRVGGGFDAIAHKPIQSRELERHLLDALYGMQAEADDLDHGLAVIHDNIAGARVLLVEDNPVNRRVATAMLERLGAEVEVANDGEEALAVHHRAPFDFILLDIEMPGLDGYQTASRIRAREAADGLPSLPIVALTAYAGAEDRARAREAGMDDYLVKPVTLDALANVLQRWRRLAPELLSPAVKPAAGTPPATAPRQETLLDLRVLDQLREVLGPAYGEFTAAFLRDTPRRLDALRTAYQAGDHGALKRAAHALKGSCANLGSARVVALCRALERAVDEDSVSAELITEAGDTVHALVDALARELPPEAAA